MKKVATKVILIPILAYIIGQALYTGYYLRQSRNLTKRTFTKSGLFGSGRSVKLYITGDSLGAGIGATSFETSLAGRVVAQLARQHTVELKNTSVSGYVASDLLQVELPAQHQDIVVLVISSNDLLHSTNLKSFENTTEEVLQRFSPLSDRVIVIGPGDVGGSDLIPLIARPYFHWKRPQYVESLQRASAKLSNITYINPVDKPPDFVGRYSQNTTSTDHFHLNDEGYRWWSDLIIQALQNPS